MRTVIIEEKLTKLGLKLPQVVKPMAAYIPAKRVGHLVFISGQVPFKDGNLAYVGKVGAECTQEEGYEAARLCALNALAAVKALVGSLDAISEIVQVRGFVNCTPDFENQPAVINGASELLVELFGEPGRHARAALGTSSLPRNVPVEVELIVRVGKAS
jgi:enamine deaminase RidA (YjgF/YER057c/UK114 family)